MRSLVLAVMVLGVAACSGPGAGDGGAADAGAATPASFTGSWKVSGHIVAPWFTGPGFAPEADAEILEKTLTLTETSASGPAVLSCAAATGAVETAPVAGLFDGNVTDAGMAASVLGIEGDSVAVLKQTCADTGAAVLAYHLVKQDRLLLARDNVIYQFDRPSAEAPAEAAPSPAAAAPVPAAPAEPAAPATPPQ